jgi:hypothetical protein
VVAAAISGVCLLLVWWIFEERLPCQEITLFTMFFGALLFLLGLGLANICFILGPLSERIISPRNTASFRHWVYGLGLAFSLVLIFSPPLLNLIAAFIGPYPCTDKFGDAHALDPASVHFNEAST